MSGICRGNFPSEFSILIKFAYNQNEQISFNFLNITNQLSVSFEDCGDEETLTIMFPSCLSTIKITLDLNEFSENVYHKIGIQVQGTELTASFDCQEVKTVVMSSDCSVLCDKSVNVHILQPLHNAQCHTSSEKVIKY